MFLTIVISHSPVKGGSGMRSPHLTSLWPHLFTPFAQKMTEVLFIDPFLLFNSTKPEYRALHDSIIDYLRFLRDMSVSSNHINKGLLQHLFVFSEVKQNWLGYSKIGNQGSGLGPDFARALHSN